MDPQPTWIAAVPAAGGVMALVAVALLVATIVVVCWRAVLRLALIAVLAVVLLVVLLLATLLARGGGETTPSGTEQASETVVFAPAPLGTSAGASGGQEDGSGAGRERLSAARRPLVHDVVSRWFTRSGHHTVLLGSESTTERCKRALHLYQGGA